MLRIGDIVKHHILGKGKILDIIRCDGVALVMFEEGKKAIVVLRKLEKVEQTEKGYQITCKSIWFMI